MALISLGEYCPFDETAPKANLYRNSKQNFNYTVSFSNSTASAVFFLQTALGILEMQFNGSRVDYYGVASLYYDKDGHPRSLNLDTSDPDMPNYVWNTSEKVVRAELGKPASSPTLTGSGPTPTVASMGVYPAVRLPLACLMLILSVLVVFIQF